MRTCEEYEALISALLDGALPDGDREELMTHMADCPVCRDYFNDQMAIRDALAGLETQAPEGFADRVMAQVRQESRQTGPAQRRKKTVAFPYWRRYAAMAACFAVVAFAGYWAWGGGQNAAGNVAADTASVLDSRAAADDGGSSAGGQESDAGSGGTAPEDSAQTDAALPPSSAEEQSGQQEDAEEATDQTTGTPESFSVTTEPETDAADSETIPDDADRELYGAKEPTISAASASSTMTLTTDSALAEAWVTENLGETWEAGASYVLTVEQFDQIQILLQANGESFLLAMEEGTPANNALDAGTEETAGPEDTEETGKTAGEPEEETEDAAGDGAGNEPEEETVIYVLQAAP